MLRSRIDELGQEQVYSLLDEKHVSRDDSVSARERGSVRTQLEERALLMLTRVLTQFHSPIRSALAAEGMSLSRITLLETLVRKGEATASQLARDLMLTNGSVTPLLKELEAERLLTRVRRRGDRRIVHVQATKKAREQLESLYLATPRELRSMFANWTVDEMKTLLDLLGRLNIS